MDVVLAVAVVADLQFAKAQPVRLGRIAVFGGCSPWSWSDLLEDVKSEID